MIAPDGHSPIVGVILAAGRGRRLGGGKQLRPWPAPDGGTPLIAAAFDAVVPVCAEMIVVVGHRADEVVAALGNRRFGDVRANPDAPMFESIRLGLRAAREIDPSAGVLLHPGDHPEVSAETLRGLLEASAIAPERAVMPEYEGRGGHPVVVPGVLAERLLEWSGDGGLRRFWKEHPEMCVRLRVDDPGVVRDLDTPDDYRA